MITENMITVKPLKIALSADTKKCKYGQVYDLSNKKATNYMPDVDTAKQKFMEFYNRFE